MVENDEPMPGRRELIDRLLDRVIPFDTRDFVGKANTLALLEIADAIDNLAAEIEKGDWTKG